MNKDELKKRLLATFIGELDEHARALEANALALEKAPGTDRPEILKALFRAAHSLKGAARSVGVPLIEAACHRVEELIGGARDGVVPVNGELVQMLLAVADALADAGRRMRAGEDVALGPLGPLLGRLDDARNVGMRASTVSASVPPPSVAAPAVSPPSGPAASTAIGGDVGHAAVRIPATRLDTLIARSGELLVARQRGARREDDVGAIRETLAQCLVAWRQLQKPLQRLTAPPESSSTPAAGKDRPRALPARAMAAVRRTSDTLKKLERDLERLAHGVASDHHALAQAASPLEEEVRRVRMLAFGDACEGLERVARDLAKAQGKEIELVIEGAHVELDRAILAALKDPLLHLVRNAADHGIERPEDRRARGKPACGRITVRAELKGGGVEVLVADDGRGLDLDAIREQAQKRKQELPVDDRELARQIFQSGFSTARLITHVSGRGVGLDVVKHAVDLVRGTVDVSFEPGRGTRFTLTLPLTLTTLRALLVVAGGQTLALPTTSVKRLVRAAASDVAQLNGREVLLSGAAPVPIVSLAEILGLSATTARPAGGKLSLVVVVADNREVAFAVDELLAEHDVVIKSLGRRLRRVRHVSGAMTLPTGRLALILAAADLVQTAVARAPTGTVASSLDQAPAAVRRRLIVADDSVTTRSLEKSILELAGYEVLAAADGVEAWQLLQERGADLVVSDVEMPRLDGFGLTEAIRGSRRFRDLPVILVTALETERDKAHGLEVGADAYLPKSAFDQKGLLEIISRLLPMREP